jgi:hypothetical protein
MFSIKSQQKKPHAIVAITEETLLQPLRLSLNMMCPIKWDLPALDKITVLAFSTFLSVF